MIRAVVVKHGTGVHWSMLENVLPTAEIIPAVVYVILAKLDLHLYNPQLKLVDCLKSKAIFPQAYSPLLTDEAATEIANKYGLKTTDAVLLGYLR